MRQINKKSIKGTWVNLTDDEEVQVLIKPFSLLSMTKVPSEDNVDFTEFQKIFNYCVLDWKGIVDEDGKVIPCNDESKQMIYEYDQELILFVVQQASALREGMVTALEAKNLKTSQTGEVQKKGK